MGARRAGHSGSPSTPRRPTPPGQAHRRPLRPRSKASPVGRWRLIERCPLFNQVVAHEGVRIGDDCVVEDRVRIGYGSHIGPRTRLVYGAYICDRVTIGADARVAGFVYDGTTIGDRSTVMESWSTSPPDRIGAGGRLT